MSLLTINKENCTQCHACVQSCPISIIESSPEDSFPYIKNANEVGCIACGHCEAVCPENALTHTFSDELVRSHFDEKLGINSDQLSAYFSNRRSIRTYSTKQVDKTILENIMNVVRYAPTGTNRQNNKWIVVSDSKVIDQLTEFTIQWMRILLQANPEMAQRLRASALIASYEQGNDRICRKAPHIVIGYCDTNYPAGIKDVTIATAHLELLLPSFGLGGCWAGYLMLALSYYPELKKLVGLDDTQSVHSALMVGYPKYSYSSIPARKKAEVTWM